MVSGSNGKIQEINHSLSPTGNHPCPAGKDAVSSGRSIPRCLFFKVMRLDALFQHLEGSLDITPAASSEAQARSLLCRSVQFPAYGSSEVPRKNPEAKRTRPRGEIDLVKSFQAPAAGRPTGTTFLTTPSTPTLPSTAKRSCSRTGCSLHFLAKTTAIDQRVADRPGQSTRSR